MSRPEGMSEDIWRAIGKLRADVRDKVLERSCLIFYGGAAATLAEADAQAYEQEVVRRTR